MAKLYVSTESLDNAMNTTIQFLRDSGYDGAIDDGTGLADIVIKPNAVLYSLFKQLAQKTEAYLSLQRATELSDSLTTDEYNDAIDSILSNWFVSRNQGKPTYGTIRYVMLSSPGFLFFHDGDSVATYNSVTLVADGDQVFSDTKNSFTEVDSVTLGTTGVYVDISVRSSEVTDVSIAQDTIVKDSAGTSKFVTAYALSDFVEGVPVEDNATFITRAKEAITTRELITSRAINTVIPDNFSDVMSVYTAGHGAVEQLRDIVQFLGTDVHVGNMADIYIGSELTVYTSKVTVSDYTNINLVDASGNNILFGTSTPFAAIIEIRDCDDNLHEYTLDCEETTYGSVGNYPSALHLKEALPIPAADATAERIKACSEITITWVGSPTVVNVHNFVYSDDNRVAAYDPMVKHKFPLRLEYILKVIKSSDTYTDAFVMDAVKATVKTYHKMINQGKIIWEESTLIACLNALECVARVLLPVDCVGYMFDPKTNETRGISIHNTIDIVAFNKDDDTTTGTIESIDPQTGTVTMSTPESIIPISDQISDNTYQLFSRNYDILVLVY